MKPITLLCLLLLVTTPLWAQIQCSADDQQRLHRQFQHLEASLDTTLGMGDYMVLVGKSLLGVPYVAQTLEVAGEPLVVNLSGLDCTTFLENAVVLSRLMASNQLESEAFYQELERVRYRNGQREGYISRLHYFTDWIRDNEAKGILQQVTQEIGGIPLDRPINFMSAHHDLYPHLQGQEMIAQLQAVERELSAITFYYLPKSQIAALEAGIQDGDLIAITTTVNGLDIAHTGFAIRIEGRVHLFHASSTLKKVVISDQPLATYLAGIKSNSGVMICRLVRPIK